MKRVEFTLSIGFVTGKHRKVMEFDDDITDEEIEQEYNEWMWNYIDGGWRVIK